MRSNSARGTRLVDLIPYRKSGNGDSGIQVHQRLEYRGANITVYRRNIGISGPASLTLPESIFPKSKNQPSFHTFPIWNESLKWPRTSQTRPSNQTDQNSCEWHPDRNVGNCGSTVRKRRQLTPTKNKGSHGQSLRRLSCADFCHSALTRKRLR